MAKLMEDKVFMAFTTYADMKMMLMAPMTAYYRLTRGVGNNSSASYIS